MNLLRYITALLITFVGFNCQAQPSLDWVAAAVSTGAGDAQVEDVFIDNTGNSYACGTFTGTADFGAFTLVAAGSSVESFVVKYSSAGTVQWAIGSSSVDVVKALSIFVDDIGMVYVGGHHKAPNLVFGSMSIPLVGNEDLFVLKLSPAGNPIHLMGPDAGTSGKNYILALTGDGGSVYVTGYYFQSALTLGGITTNPPTQDDFFVARLDSNLSSANWVEDHGGTKREYGTGIAVDGNRVFVCGYYNQNNPITFSANPTDYVLPNLGHESIFLASFARNNGSVNWATHAGSQFGNSNANDLVVNGSNVFVTGFYAGICVFSQSEQTGGPFIYNDTLLTAGGSDVFVASYNYSGDVVDVWSEGGTLNDVGHGIALDPTCTEVQVCGEFRSTVLFGGTDSHVATSTDAFVAAYDYTGAYSWSFQESSSGDEFHSAIAADNGTTVVGGEFSQNTTFSTSPQTTISNLGGLDYFVTNFQCANVVLCAPEITCPPTDVVSANASCNYLLGDYVGTEVVIDNCGLGYSVVQDPPENTLLDAGTHQVSMTVTDIAGNQDVCIFDVVIEALVNPTVVTCGQTLIGENTAGNGNTGDNFSCVGFPTPGEDIYYQITVPVGNYWIQVTMENMVDLEDNGAHVFWVGNGCPLGSGCIDNEYFDETTDLFNNGSDTWKLQATGPGTYYLVVDGTDPSGINSYDISFDCIESGIEFDESCGVGGGDVDSDGIIPEVNGTPSLDVEPCESVTVCNNLLIANPIDFEWMDSVHMRLGPCYTNISNITPNGNPGWYTADGDWVGSYDGPSTSITWDFVNPPSNFGDGAGGNYSCATSGSLNLYEFCFDADIVSGCNADSLLNITIVVSDDGVGGSGGTASSVDVSLVDDFTVTIPSASFNYSASSFCQGDANPSPTINGTTGGTFAGDPGLVVSGTTGVIDLLASTPGTYDVTYSVGPCPIIGVFQVTVVAEDDPAFTYGAGSYCQGISNPSATITGTSGGIFTGSAGLVFANASTGEIDLTGSTVGGPYTITYTTPGICSNTATFTVTITPGDDATFSYGAASFCQGDANPAATITGLGGGTFTGQAGVVFANASTGEIDLLGSTAGGPYAITYTTSGPCPSASTFDITINPEDDPSFSYGAASYCQSGTNPSANITGTGGGTFIFPIGLVFANAGTGEIDLAGSTVGGPYTIVYTTSGPCPNSSTFDVWIIADDDPSFDYSAASYCQGGTNPSATITGLGGGTFTSSAGLLFANAATGEIDLLGSTAGGPYTITYTTSGACPNSSTFDITIIAEDDPAFTYGAASYCQGGTNPTATITGLGGGTFTGSAGLMFANAGTGEIDLAGSTIGGPYTVTYTTSGPCPNSSTFDVSITLEDDPSFSYSAASFCQGGTNPLTTITGVGGGSFTGTSGLVFANAGTGEIDLAGSTVGGPYTVTYTTSGACPNSSTFDVTINAEDDPAFTYGAASYCQGGTNPTATITGLGGGTFTGSAGLMFANAGTGEIDLAGSTAGGPYTVTYTTSGPCPNSSTFDVTIIAEDDPSFSYSAASYCQGGTNPSATITGLGGGTFTSSAGLMFANASTGEIDLLGSVAGGPYTITYTTSGPCPNSSTFDVTINAEDDPTFSYGAASYCQGETNPLATISGTGGGMFTGTAGLVFTNPSTGEIDLAGSTPGGTYTITYTTLGSCPNSSTFDVTINSVDAVSLQYASLEYCQSDDNQVPVFSPAGGVFSAPTGLDIDVSSGEFSPSTSSGGSYTVTYISNGTCPDTASADIIIYDLSNANAGVDQALGFTFQTSLDAIPPSVGSGIWSSQNSSIQIDDVNDPYSNVSLLEMGENVFTWTVSNGVCPVDQDQVIIVVDDLRIPQAVTPNNDGDNDFFEIVSIDDVTCQLQIFNRWGQVVYKNDNYDNDWQGTNMKDEQLENDTYFYIAIIDGRRTFNGYVVLKR